MLSQAEAESPRQFCLVSTVSSQKSWTATSGMSLTIDGEDTKVYSGPAAIQWEIGGTTSAGCAYEGMASLTGTGQLTIFGSSNEYAHEIRSPAQTVPVRVTCPLTGTTTELVRPMNGDAASTGALAQPDPPRAPVMFVGTRTYGSDPAVAWRWSVVGQ